MKNNRQAQDKEEGLGLRNNFDTRSSHVIPALIHKVGKTKDEVRGNVEVREQVIRPVSSSVGWTRLGDMPRR